MRSFATVLPTLMLGLWLAGCRAATPPVATAPPAAPQPVSMTADIAEPGADPCDCPHKEVRWTRDSAEHRASLIQAYRLAGEVLTAMAADLEPGTWAVALDADETVLDNSLYQQERVAICQDYTPESWVEWVARREAQPLPGALGFLARIHELGGKIAIVTNRKQAECPDTEANFKAISMPYDVILCRREDRRKEGRWQQVREGTAADGLPPLDIVMWLGDNITDFPDLDQTIRQRPEVAFERFGLQYFVMPNPMYGSWQRRDEE